MVSALFVPYMSPTNLHSVPTFGINLITITADICNQTNTNSISHIAMTTPSISKRSTASRAACAADCDQQEARLQQAAAELGNGTFSSIRKAAAANSVPESTLRGRLSGVPTIREGHASMQALTPAAETALLEHIRRCACSGFPLTPAQIRDYANTVSRGIPGCTDAPDVGWNWLQGFLLRHPSICSHWSRCLDNARLTGTDANGIQAWYQQLGRIVNEYSVLSTNIYNMDETGFRFGQGGSERVIVPSGDQAARFKAQPGTRESATAIECIGTGGQILPPVIITKGASHMVGEHRKMANVPASWHFAKTDRGWTTQELAVDWLKTVFDANTTPSTPSEWRLLIIDGHNSHTSTEFLVTAWNRRIIPFCFPAHSTHIMQPLDVSVFGPVSAAYKQIINNLAPQSISDVNRSQFVTFYAQARAKALTPTAARKAFADCGIAVKPNAEKVLNRLAGHQQAQRTGTTQQSPLQECLPPQTSTAVSSALDAFRHEPNPRDAYTLKQTLMQAYERPHATISVLEAENKLLQEQEDRRRHAAKKMRGKKKVGDQMILSKDIMITRQHAEQELVRKKPAIAARQKQERRKKQRQQEKRVVLPPPAMINDRDEACADNNNDASASSAIPTTSARQDIIDILDDGEPLSPVEDNDIDPACFYDSVPVASSSRVKL
ncbi:related to transposase [Ustilago trichophora]|uniref:Related to transposase n=1 Tax=Ustilago trichophora TaxID=86804 RepID=A0A5C3ED31_9BASI|nr:related to transposase [Ustilago trichophora]